MKLRGAVVALLLASTCTSTCAVLHAQEPAAALHPVITGEVLHANTVEFGLLSFRDVVTKPQLVGKRMTFADCQGKAYGGTVGGWLSTDLGSGDYQARFEVTAADLANLLRQLGGNAENLGGAVNGWVEFSLNAAKPDDLVGRGELTIRGGSLVQLPLLANLLVGDPAASRSKDELDCRFEIRERRVWLVSSRLKSPAASIAITGSIGFEGDLRLGLEPTFTNRITDAITGGIATLVLNPITRRAARLSVRGQISHPVLVANPFGRPGE